jgi:hypothetical protein
LTKRPIAQNFALATEASGTKAVDETIIETPIIKLLVFGHVDGIR